jgi:RHS repeat-associated protein
MAFCARGYCSEPPVVAGYTQMPTSGAQVLSIKNYRTGKPCNWSIQNDDGQKGTLSSATGENVTYTAPSANPGCEDSPIIQVECDGLVGTFNIAVNGYAGNQTAWVQVDDWKSKLCDGSDKKCGWRTCDAYCLRWRDYTCAGFYHEYSCQTSEACDPNISNQCFNDTCEPTSYSYEPIEQCMAWCEWQAGGAAGSLVDERSPAMITSGCCPDRVASWYESASARPADLEVGRGECIALVSNPVGIYKGNNTEKQEDVRFSTPGRPPFVFTRYYDSRITRSVPFGRGWTHNFTTLLNPADTFEGQTYVRINDESGKGYYFTEESAGLYKGAFNERSFVRAEGGNYFWYRSDGTRCAFDSAGKPLWTQDEVGNRQTLTRDSLSRVETITDEASGRVLTLHYNENNLITHISGPVTDAVPDGVWVNYGYDANLNLASVTYADGSGLDYIYGDPNDIHNLPEKHDKGGHLLSSWTYDSSDRVIESLTRDGRGVTIYYVNEHRVRVTDAYGVSRTYFIWDINGRDRITDITGAGECPGCGQEVKRLEYDSGMRIIEKEYVNGLINQYDDFDSWGNAQTVIEAVGTPDEKIVTYTFHPDINTKLSETEPSLLGEGNKVTIWDYDNDGNATANENPTRLLYRKIEQGLTKDLSGNVVPFEYVTNYTHNAKGQVTTIDGPEPGTQDLTIFTYDGATGNLLSVTRPEVGTTTYSDYDAAGQVGRVTDPNGNVITYAYDGRGRVAAMTNLADGSVTSYDYNTAGEIEQITQPNGVTSDFWYDPTYGRLIRIDDSVGNYVRYGYDDQGNRAELSHFDSAAQRRLWKRFDYHGTSFPGKLWKEINPDNSYAQYTYDAGGNVSVISDAGGKSTLYGYDVLDRLTTVTQPGSTVTSYGYDDQGNLISVTDAENHQTIYVYDDLGRLLETVSPDTGTTRYAYDAAGNLISKSDANGVTATYDYDDFNRLTAIHFPDSTQDITYTYDQGTNGKGRLTGMTDPSGSYSYAYNALGNLLSEEKTVDGVTYTTQYAYDAAGVLTGMTYPDGRTVTYELDGAGRVNRVTTVKESVSGILAQNVSYLPFGPLSGFTYGNGTTVTKTFDQLYRLTDLAAGTVQSLAYTLDPVGNITAITNNLDDTRNQAFGYDDLYRLASAAGIYGAMAYTYDKAGNRLTETVNGETDTYTYQTGTSRLSAVTGVNPESFTLDANGNTTGMDEKTLIYNQNNRLIRVSENASAVGEYVYNGNGQRIKKIAAGEATIYHYDRFGNLIGESTPSGKFISEYVYLDNTRLAAIAPEAAQEITVHVATSTGGRLSGIPVYAFTETGSYTGKSALTDEDGIAQFELTDFADGSYKFRADYLSCRFWSEVITVPGTYNSTVEVAEETATIRVIQGGVAKAGVKVYLFNAAGSYLGIFGTTDTNGEVTFDLPSGKNFKFRADNLGNQYWSDVLTIVAGGVNETGIATGGGTLTVTVDKGEGTPIANTKVYLFKGNGASYLGLWGTTDTQGNAAFAVSSGDYVVRADYMGYQFWSTVVTVTSDDALLVSIPHEDVTVTVHGDDNGDTEARDGVNVYLFTETGTYLGVSRVADARGEAVFNVPEKSYKVRADFMGQKYWSEAFTWTDKTVTIQEGTALVTMTHTGLSVEGVNVYVFTGSGSYLGLHDVTDQDGPVSFRLPAGDYNFRADYQGSQFWSGVFGVIAHVENPVTISAGGGTFALTVLKGVSDPLVGVNCYLFTDTGSYLGSHEVTSSEGEVAFSLADGDYKMRVDHLGYQFWTDVFTVPTTLSMDHTIAHQDVTITVAGDYNGNIEARSGVPVYLFTSAGSYLGQKKTSDVQGQVTFNVPGQDHKVRADFRTKQYWSSIFNWIDETITIKDGVAEIHVTMGASPIENVPVYVFNDLGSYLGINAQTDENGIVDFRLPAGTYKFRADHLSNKYWATEPVTAHEVNVIDVDTGGGIFTATVEKAAGQPIGDVPVYAFTAGGAYLGMTAHTDAQGQVSFNLSDGDYRFRADYRGYQFWTGTSTVPTSLSDVLTIPHQDVTVTVERLYQAPAESLENIPVYLFTETGSYLGQSLTTNAQGQAVLNLPERSYKVRTDYLGYQFWSSPFTWADRTVTINHGLAELHVTRGGADVVGAPVYLFTPAGSYLGRNERTDATGIAQFLLPDRQYKFRVDHGGTQYWSDVVTIIPFEENNIELNLDLLALDLTNNPKPVRYHGVAPELEKDTPVVAFLSALPGFWADNAHAQGGGEVVYFFVNDHLGTPQMLIDETGTVVWSADYRPFGEPSVTVNGIQNNFRFPGQYFDRETGLHYNWHRYYDPGTGRYLRADPIGLYGGVNLFGYVHGNPIVRSDEVGLWLSQGGAYVHQRVIYLNIGKDLPRNLHLSLVQSQFFADSLQFQNAENAYRHAMTGGEQSWVEARRRANDFIRSQFEKAWQKRECGDEEGALFEFGVALHTLQDYTSPSHSGFQAWTGEENNWQKFKHGFPEAFDPGERSELYRVTRDAWGWYNSGSLPQGDLFLGYGSD